MGLGGSRESCTAWVHHLDPGIEDGSPVHEKGEASGNGVANRPELTPELTVIVGNPAGRVRRMDRTVAGTTGGGGPKMSTVASVLAVVTTG